MADNFGLKIGVEGEKEFKKALSEINQSFKVLGSEMQLVSSEFDKNDKSVQALTARNTVLNKEIDTQKDKIETLQKALANASESFGENDKRTQNWQIQLNRAQAELNGMQRELKDNEKALNSVGQEFDDAENEAEQFGEGVKKAADTAGDAEGKFSKLGGVLKGVGIALAAGVAAIGTAAVSAGKSLVDMAVSSATYADEMITQSTVTGMSVESLQAYSYAADLVDVSLDTLTGSMAKQVKSMASARDGSKSMKEAYEKLGISVANSDGSLRDSETVYWETIDALGRMQEGAERDALAMQLFGKSAQELNPLIAQGSAGIAELTDEAKRMGAVMSEDTINQLGKFDDSIQRLKQGSEAAKRVMGTVLLPQLQTLADDGVTLLGEFTKGLVDAGGDFNKISEVIGNTVGGLVSMIMENLPKLIQVGLDMVSAVGGAIVDNLPIIVDSAVQIVMVLLKGLIDALPQITEGAVQLILALVDGIVANLPALVEAALQMIATLAQGLTDTLPTLIPSVISAITTIVQVLIENLPLILDAALQLVIGLAEGIIAAIPVLIEALPQLIISLVDFIISAIPQIIDAGIQLLTSLISALPEIITAIVTAIPQIVDGLITAIINSIPLLIDAGIKLLVALIQNLPQIIITIVNAIPQIVTSIVNALVGNIDKIIMAGVQLFVALIQNLPTIIVEIVKAVPLIIAGIVSAFTGSIGKIVEVGSNLIKGLWQGISDAGAWLWNKISGFFGGVVDRIKGFFGIHSPSTLFAGLGTNMAEGLGIGFEDEMDKVADDMQNAIPSNIDMNGTVSATTSDTGRGISNSPLVVVQQMIVRNEDDIRKVSQELYNLMQSGSRAQGRFVTV